MVELGELGFWLAVGIVVAAWILSDARKKRDKARQKQETLRALLTTEGKSATEILAYMRESDAAEQKREDEQWVAMDRSGRKLLAVLAAIVAGIVAFFISVRVLSGPVEPSSPFALAVLLAPFAVGALVAFLVYVLLRGKKNVPPPGA